MQGNLHVSPRCAPPLDLCECAAQGETASSWLTLGSQFMNPASAYRRLAPIELARGVRRARTDATPFRHFATLSHGREAGREGQDKRTVDVEWGPHAQDGASAADDELALWAPLLPRLAPDPHREPPWYVPFESACPCSLSERSATSALTCFPAPSDPAYEHQVRRRYSIPVLRGLRPNLTLSIPFMGP